MPLLDIHGLAKTPLELAMNYEANNSPGRVRQLKYEQVIEGAGIVAVSASRVEDKKYLNFGVDI